jgi:hypothetical protein
MDIGSVHAGKAFAEQPVASKVFPKCEVRKA